MPRPSSHCSDSNTLDSPDGRGELTNVTEKLVDILRESNGAPFLFVGSGFSRRYIGLEAWADLLKKFCADIREFGYYFSTANGDLPLAASLMAKDFNEAWWTLAKYEDSRKSAADYPLTNVSASIKYEIARYLSNISVDYTKNELLKDEISALSQMNVDGIITTNWDLLLEDLFPDYKVFIGQEELFFANPQGIAEIYKIHGCASRPPSMVLTQEDYQDFTDKNPYLAAKLITIFAEHPVIFIGYSISDPHIQGIIGSIARCLGPDKLGQFEKNLIFLSRAESSDKDVVEEATISIGERTVRVTVVKCNDFSMVYAAVEATKRKIPARILRYCKEQMYELIHSSSPEAKLAVVDLDEIDKSDEVEFVVGVGVAEKYKSDEKLDADEGSAALADRGYSGVTISDVFSDVIADTSCFSAADLLRSAYPTFKRFNNRYIPGFRYLKVAGISSKLELDSSEFAAARDILRKAQRKGFSTSNYRGQYENHYKSLSTQEIIDTLTPEKAALIIPFQPISEVQTEALKTFLQTHFESKMQSPYVSFFRKLACFYDRAAFGFDV